MARVPGGADASALLYTGQTLAFCVAGLIAAAVFATLEGKHGLAGWYVRSLDLHLPSHVIFP